MRAGTATMSFFIAAHRKLRYVGEHRATRHLNVHVARTLAAFLPRHEIDLATVGNKVRMENAAVVFGEVLSFLREKFGIAGIEAVFEHIVGVVDELRIAK